jgi:hypothetical protein
VLLGKEHARGLGELPRFVVDIDRSLKGRGHIDAIVVVMVETPPKMLRGNFQLQQQWQCRGKKEEKCCNGQCFQNKIELW